MEIRPDYYDSFKCIKDKCKHNCCIGWEIDIDKATLKKYENQTGELHNELKKSIDYEPTAHFILNKNERCPFLNDNNLCELIIAGGEDMLCQICRDHPRFYNSVYGITEKGIGLSCEAAARIILCKTSPVKFICDGALPNEAFFAERNEIFGILQNRERPLKDRINELLAWANISLPIGEINFIDVYKKLERLDGTWGKHLEGLDAITPEIPNGLEIAFEQLLCYFIYRHLSGCLEDFLFYERIQFSILSCFVIASMNKTETTEEMLEIARLYSSEIEYSDENIEILLDILNEYNEK